MNCRENKTIYDESEKIWKGPNYVHYYNPDCSVGRIAFEEMRRRGNKICQISNTENTHLSYEEARLQAIRIARSFECLGVKQSDIIGITGRNTTHLLAVILGCFFHGTAYHAINPNYGKETSKKLFEITKPKIIFCDGQDLEKIQYASNDFKAKIYTLKNHIKGVPSVLELLKPTGDEYEYEPAKLENGSGHTLAILCSSGTSGTPKAVTIPHCSHVLTLTNLLTNDDIIFVNSTMDWLTALLALLSSIIYGATRIITDLPYTPEYYLKLLEKYKVTFTICSTPPMIALSKCKEATVEKLENLRYFFYSGSKVAYSVQEKMQNLLKNGYAINCYGLSEFNGYVCRNFNFKEKPQAAGTLVPGAQVCIVNENGERCGPNECGEIWCTHGEYWGGYYNNKKASCEIYDENGWFHSGDKGYFDEDGYLYIVDRIKDLLKYQRMQYYPSQIEEVILKMPAVKEVCVFGIQCDEGEAAAAAVVIEDGSEFKAEGVIEFVKDNEEESFRHLHGGCKLYKELPKTANLKNDRKAAKNLFLGYK